MRTQKGKKRTLRQNEVFCTFVLRNMKRGRERRERGRVYGVCDWARIPKRDEMKDFGPIFLFSSDKICSVH